MQVQQKMKTKTVSQTRQLAIKKMTLSMQTSSRRLVQRRNSQKRRLKLIIITSTMMSLTMMKRKMEATKNKQQSLRLSNLPLQSLSQSQTLSLRPSSLP